MFVNNNQSIFKKKLVEFKKHEGATESQGVAYQKSNKVHLTRLVVVNMLSLLIDDYHPDELRLLNFSLPVQSF